MDEVVHAAILAHYKGHIFLQKKRHRYARHARVIIIILQSDISCARRSCTMATNILYAIEKKKSRLIILSRRLLSLFC